VKVSVVVPLYNKARYVERSLSSISAQTFTDFEAIVVDDGSTDGGAELASRHDDSRVRVIRQKNAGPGPARNRGASEARGELLAFLDADDAWSPQYLSRAMEIFERVPPSVAAVSCGYLEMPAARSTRQMWQARGVTEGSQRLSPDTAPLLAVHMLAYMSPWNTVVRKEVFDRLGGFYDREKRLYGEDSFFWLKVLLNEGVHFHFEPLAFYHIDASALAKNLAGARPVEPFLEFPEDIRAHCPAELQSLLERILGIRALKTGCMLGYWGKWREGREVIRRVGAWRWRLPFLFPAAILTTPFGGAIGQTHRALARLRSS
jgi:hypothetical protein